MKHPASSSETFYGQASQKRVWPHGTSVKVAVAMVDKADFTQYYSRRCG